MLEIRVIRKKYVPTDEMVSAGELEYLDVSDHTETMRLSEFIRFVKMQGIGQWELSCSGGPHPWAWMSANGLDNPHTYEHEELSLHCADKNTSRWVRYLKAAQIRRLI